MSRLTSGLNRLRRKEIWGIPLLILTGWIYATLSLLMDAVLLNQPSPFWIVIFIATFSEVVLLAWLFRVQILNRFNIDSVLLNVAVAGLLGLIKNVTVAPLAIGVGLLEYSQWEFRLFGGFTLGAGIFVFAGLALGARTEHTAAMAQLTQVQNTLLTLRNSSKARLKETNEALAQHARELLLPKLEQLLALVRDKGDAGAAVANLRDLIQNEVRPLSNQLSSTAVELVDFSVDLASVPKRYQLFRPKVELRGLIRPNAAAISNGLGALLLAYAILDAPRCNAVFYLSFLSWGLVWVAKLIIPAGLEVSRRQAMTYLFVTGTVMFLPLYLIEISEFENLVEPWLMLIMWPSSVVSLMSFAFSESLDRDRFAVRRALQADNQALAHDQALFEQQLWLGRRAWQFVVHGTVQSALTAALTRLQSTPEPEPYILNRVADDLDRARKAMQETPNRKVDLADSIYQLKATWGGICDIQTMISERAKRALQINNDAAQCLNEIIKEAVSNAIRHGEAKNITIDIDRLDDFNLEILVSNNGLPLATQNQLGIGSSLIEELTTDWSIKSNAASGLTVFKANLPLQRG